MNVPPDLEVRIKHAVRDMSHSEAEGFGLRLAEIATGEPVGFVRCDKAGLVGVLDKNGPGSEANEIRDLTERYMRRELDEAGQRRLLQLMDQAEAMRMKARG